MQTDPTLPPPAKTPLRTRLMRVGMAAVLLLVLWLLGQSGFFTPPAATPPPVATAEPPLTMPVLSEPAPAPVVEPAVEEASPKPEPVPVEEPEAEEPKAEPAAPPVPPMPVNDGLRALEEKHSRTLQTLMMLDAYDRLKDAVLSGKPFVSELGVLVVHAAGRPEVETAALTLQDHAATGVPTLEMLQQQFAPALHTALRQSTDAPETMWERIRQRMRSLIIIRRVDETAENTPQATLARAEKAMAKGDVRTALQLLEAQPSFAAWRESAALHLAAREALPHIKTIILSSTTP